ncbi:hypothetical protein P8631_02760 [Guyparkeria sp. 1SP6A2]|nr:hypothetical protein [Guyparkeria sp. 1SP6A2]
MTYPALMAALTALLIQAPAQAEPPAHAGKPGDASQQAERGNTKHSMAAPPQRQAERDERGAERGERELPNYRISTRERMQIQDWYNRNLPPGLAKQGKIPPGHAKRLERGSSWPPQDVEYERLPRELTRRLSPLPENMDYYRVGPDVVIADTAGQIVSDVVYGVLNR